MSAELSSPLRAALIRLSAMTPADREGVLADLDEGARLRVRRLLTSVAVDDDLGAVSRLSSLADLGLSDWLIERLRSNSEVANAMTDRSKMALDLCVREFLSLKPDDGTAGQPAQDGGLSSLNRRRMR